VCYVQTNTVLYSTLVHIVSFKEKLLMYLVRETYPDLSLHNEGGKKSDEDRYRGLVEC
jgi:hypothetical protein